MHSFIDKLNSSVKIMRETIKITNVLFNQDEIDKQILYSMILKDVETKKRSQNPKSFNSDKNCISCQAFGSQVLLALKLACSNYNPDPVIVNNRETNRKELLEKQERLIKNIFETFETKHKENESNLSLRSLTPELPNINKIRKE